MALKAVGGKYEGVWINELKNGDISYYINYRDENNKPKKIAVGKKTAVSDFSIKDAYAKLIEIKYKLQHNEEPIIKGGRVNKTKLNDLYDKYLIWAKGNKKTWRDDEIRYEKHIKPRFGNKAVRSLKSIDFENMKQELLKQGLSASSVKHCLAICRQIFNYAIKNDFMTNFTNPIGAGRVKLPEPDNTRLGYLTKEQARELLEITKMTNKNTYYLVSFLLFTGARFSEIANLRWQDVDLHTNRIFLKKTKRGNERHIYIASQLLEVINELREVSDSDLVLTRANGTAFIEMPKYFGSAMDEIIPNNSTKETKYKITAHSLRHTHASWLASNGLDVLQIKEQLGHKTLEMTMRYAHLIPNKRHEATKSMII